MQIKVTAHCQWVRRNNGIVKMLFVGPAKASDPKAQETLIFVNAPIVHGEAMPEEGKSYVVDISLASQERTTRD